MRKTTANKLLTAITDNLVSVTSAVIRKHDVNPLSSIRERIPKQGRHDDDRPHEQAV